MGAERAARGPAASPPDVAEQVAREPAGAPPTAAERIEGELTEEELTAWGERIGAAVTPPVFIALRGELGAGKSVLARAIARGAGVRGPMPSPTFNLLYRYDAARDAAVVHLDLYRLERPDEVWELGWRELGDGREIVLVEWPERAETLLPADRWEIHLEAPFALAEIRRVRGRRFGGAPGIPVP
jgi:tRNA threonylcarbamoyladenosine biosynthesis protein TsaE